jgi:hypothetical protein
MANDNGKHASRQNILARKNSEQETRSNERLRCLVLRLAKSGLSLQPLAVEYLKEVNALDVETIGDLILAKLKEKNVPGGIITKELLAEVLLSSPPRIVERL